MRAAVNEDAPPGPEQDAPVGAALGMPASPACTAACRSR